MIIEGVEFTLEDLRQAVLDYCEKHLRAHPNVVHVCSYKKPVIVIETLTSGWVSAEEFRHKHNA